MIYAVSAELNAGLAAEFHDKLTNGTIARQEPDGNEIIAAMARAGFPVGLAISIIDGDDDRIT